MTKSEKRYRNSVAALCCILVIAIISLGVNIYSAGHEDSEAESGNNAGGSQVVDSDLENKAENGENEDEEKNGEVAANIITAGIPDELLELMNKNPETSDFVLAYPEREQYLGKIDLSSDYVEGQIPMFLQWDKRWGYQSYGDGIIALDGCGPTCLSMVMIGLTGDLKYDPKYIADFSIKGGWYENGASKWGLMTLGAEELGLEVTEIPLWENSINAQLEAGNPVICIMGPGDFTDDGHFIVISEVEDDGYVIRDPNSMSNSSRLWTFEELKGQIRNIWAYTVE